MSGAGPSHPVVPEHSARRGELARLVAAQVCLHATMAGMRMATPLLALKAGYSTLAVGLLLALFSLTQVFLALPAGRYADRHGLVRPVGFAVVAAVTGAGVAFLFPHVPALCVSALLTGGAAGIVVIALQRHVGRAAADATELKRVFSWLAIGPAVSNFVGPLLAGVLIDHAGIWLGGSMGDTNGFRAAFLAMALLPLLTWYWVRTARELPPVALQPQRSRWQALDLLQEPMMRRLMIVNWMLSACWDTHTFVLPVLGVERGFSASVIGAILGGFAVAAAMVRVLIPVVAAHLHEWVVVTGAMLATALCFAAYPFLQQAWSMGLCSVLLGLALGCVQPMLMSTLHQITPEARHGEALGLRLMALNASSVAMPFLFGSAGAVVGVSLVFWSMGTVVGLGAQQAWRLRPAAHNPSPG